MKFSKIPGYAGKVLRTAQKQAKTLFKEIKTRVKQVIQEKTSPPQQPQPPRYPKPNFTQHAPPPQTKTGSGFYPDMRGHQFRPRFKGQDYVRQGINNEIKLLTKNLGVNVPHKTVLEAYKAAKQEAGIQSAGQLPDQARADKLLQSFRKNLRKAVQPPAPPPVPPQTKPAEKPLTNAEKRMNKLVTLNKEFKKVRSLGEGKALLTKAFPNIPPGKEANYLKRMSLEIHPDKNPDIKEQATKAMQALNNIKDLFAKLK